MFTEWIYVAENLRRPYDDSFANLTAQDVNAMVAFLRSIPPVKNKVPGPFGPTETPTSFVMKVVPPPAPK